MGGGLAWAGGPVAVADGAVVPVAGGALVTVVGVGGPAGAAADEGGAPADVVSSSASRTPTTLTV